MMQDFTDLTYASSEQHRESTQPRIRRDFLDLEKIKEKLSTCTPFSADPSLRNIVTGVVAKEDVNVHQFENVGRKITEKMVGNPVFGYSYKRKDRAKTLADEFNIKVSQGQTIDPALLFQRLLFVLASGDLSLEDVMSYELSTFPTALFEAKEILRKADKPQLANMQLLNTPSSNQASLSTITFHLQITMSSMGVPSYIGYRGRGVTGMAPLQSRMLTSPYAIMVKQR